MNRYNSYKDSGVEWIGEIPKNWFISKYKYFYNSNMGATILKENLDENGKIPVFSATESDKIFGYVSNSNVILEKGDIVIPARGNSIGHIMLVNSKSTCTQTTIYSKKQNQRILDKYTFYYLKGFRELLFHFDNTAIPQITVGQIKENKIILPPIQEQEQIVAYLDKKTAIVDTLISSKEKKINILKEKRTALINHVITKGLDPKVKLKDSGVEWIGEIPEHWEKLKIKNILSKKPDNGLFKRKDDFVENDGFGFVNVADLFNDNNTIKIDKLSKVIVTKEELKKAVLEEGDIFFVRSSLKLEGIGVSSIVINIDKPLVYDCHIIRIKPDKLKISPLFLIKALNSSSYRNYLVSVSETTTMTTISQDKIKDLIILIPNVSEQQKIIEHLDKQTQEIDELISLELKKIETLKEYRQALISEVVTGKIKVIKD